MKVRKKHLKARATTPAAQACWDRPWSHIFIHLWDVGFSCGKPQHETRSDQVWAGVPIGFTIGVTLGDAVDAWSTWPHRLGCFGMFRGYIPTLEFLDSVGF